MPEVDISEFDERLNSRECNQAIRDIVARLRAAADQAGPVVWRAHSTPGGDWGITGKRANRVFCLVDPKPSVPHVCVSVVGADEDDVKAAGTVHRRKNAESWVDIGDMCGANLLGPLIAQAYAAAGVALNRHVERASSRPATTALVQRAQVVVAPGRLTSAGNHRHQISAGHPPSDLRKDLDARGFVHAWVTRTLDSGKSCRAEIKRFLGEAFVAAHPAFTHRAGWYGSFKWLSAAAWCATRASSSPGYPGEFRKALAGYVENLEQVQSKEAILRRPLRGRHAVPPDLWLFTGRRGPLSEREHERFMSSCDVLTSSNSARRTRDGWCWHEGPVDGDHEHIEVRYGDASKTGYEGWVPVALVGRPAQRVFPVRWVAETDGQAAIEVRRELDFYLVEHPATYPETGHPWEYAVYHCGTAANMYSHVHWSHFASGQHGKRYSSMVVQLPPGNAAKEFCSGD